MKHANGISSRLSAFVAESNFTDLPDRTVDMTKRCLLDAIGVSLAASGLGEGCRAFVDIAVAQGGHPMCTIFGVSQKVPVEAAAFANGSMAHAMDYEDAHDGTLLHPNAPTVPAALAISEAFGPVTGKELVLALAIGCEVAVRIGQALRVSLTDYGWYPPPILAAFGATAATAKLLRLTPAQVRDAFSLTLCQATCSAEIKYSPDSVVRAVRDAFAARAGVTSALLAARGVSGFEEPFEGRAGFFEMFARGNYEPNALTEDLGKRFEIDNISFKPWPSCRGTHSSIEGSLELLKRNPILPNQIAAVNVRGSRILRMLNEPQETKRRPCTAIDAKFSVPFTTAVALVQRRVTLDEFHPLALKDETVLGVARKVFLEIDESLPEHDIGCELKITTGDGSAYQVRVGAPLGNPANPMGETAFLSKFTDCARYAREPIDADGARRICEATLALEQIDDIGEHFMPLMCGSSA
jgi:2-methylcitrate dehydratase PrpD